MFETGEVFTAENANLIRLAHFTEEFFRISLRLLHCEWVLVTPYHVKILQTYSTFLRFRQKIESVEFFLFFRCLKNWLFFVVSEICACSQSVQYLLGGVYEADVGEAVGVTDVGDLLGV